MRRSTSPQDGEAGFTLIELVVAFTVTAITVTGVLLAVQTAVRHSAYPMIDQQAQAVARAYLEEILPKSYRDPDGPPLGPVCPAPEASRDLYDNVCDYQSVDDFGARDQTGTPVPGLGDYRVRVSVDTTATLNTLSGSAEVLRVDVRVTHSDLVDTTVSAYRAFY